VIGGGGHTTALLRSAARTPQAVPVDLAGTGPSVCETFDAAGVRRSRVAVPGGRTVRAVVLPGGFTIVRR
jgi:hypothetical protein